MAKRTTESWIDGEKLLAFLNAEDDLTVVVRGHLCLEAVLNALLERSVPAELTHLRGMRFPARVDLAVALGKIPLESRRAWLQVNELRNLFAHDLHATVDEEITAAFEEAVALRPHRRDGLFVNLSRRPTSRHRLAAGIGCLWADAVNKLMTDHPGSMVLEAVDARLREP